MPRGRAARAEGAASDAAAPKNAVNASYCQGQEAAGAQKVGQKRRGALQEVDGNRKTRRSSRGADSAGASAKSAAPPSDRQLRSRSRERVAEKPAKQSKKKAPSFKVYEDPVIVEGAGGSARRASGADKKKQTACQASAQSETALPTGKPVGNDDTQATNTEGTGHTSSGGWEVLEVEQGRAQHLADGEEAAGSGNAPECSKDTRGTAEGESEHKEEALDDTISDNAGEMPVDEQPGMCMEEGKVGKKESAPASKASVDAALRQGELGKEMLDGEDAVAAVADVSASRGVRAVPAAVGGSSSSARPFDLDSNDRMDEFCVTEYTEEIYSYLRENEGRSMVDPDYMSGQDDINAKMRVILMDWLIEVHLKFKLRQETIYLCFQLIDRFLEKNTVRRGKLQLVGVTGLMLASKYEEIYPPEVRDYVYICDNAYTRQDILDMEQTMLARLGYRLSLPTVWSFMKRFLKAAGRQVNEPDSYFHLISYAIELAMIQIRSLRFKPSMLVASSIYLINTLQEEDTCWSEQLKHHTGYDVSDLEDCAAELRSLIADAPREPKYRAVYKKFGHRQFESVALLPYLQELVEGEPVADP